jgi:hypothetical protein
MLTHEITLPLPAHPHKVDHTLALDEPYHLGHRILRRDRDHHVNVVGHEMPFLNPGFLLNGQLAEHFPEVLPQLSVPGPSAALKTTWYLYSH